MDFCFTGRSREPTRGLICYVTGNELKCSVVAFFIHSIRICFFPSTRSDMVSPSFVTLNPSRIENICPDIKDVTNWHVSHKTNKTFLIEFTCHILPLLLSVFPLRFLVVVGQFASLLNDIWWKWMPDVRHSPSIWQLDAGCGDADSEWNECNKYCLFPAQE